MHKISVKGWAGLSSRLESSSSRWFRFPGPVGF